MPLGIESFFHQTNNADDEMADAPVADEAAGSLPPSRQISRRSRSMANNESQANSLPPSGQPETVCDDDNGHHHHHQRRQSLIYTAALYYCFIAVGLNSSIFNPTLVQLSHIFKTDLRTVSLIFPLRAIGCTVGTLSNGFLNSYFSQSRQLILVCMLVLKSLTTFLVPHWQSIHQFHANAFFQGFFTAANVVMVNVWLTEIWSRRGRSPSAIDQNKIDIGNVLMQGLHFFFGCGTILGPLVAEPFLQDPFQDQPGFVANNLVWPYAIAACLGISTATVFYILLMVSPYQQPQLKFKAAAAAGSSDEDILIDVDHRPTASRLRIPVILSAALFLATFACSEGTYLQFSASFCTKTGLHMTQPDAAVMASILAISFTAFRGLSVLVAMKLSPGTMIFMDLITIFVGNTLVFLSANNNRWWLATGYILLGAGFSSVFPSLFPYLERKNYPVTDWVGSLITFSGGAAQVMAPFIIGLLIDRQPYVLVYFTFASVIGSAIMFSTMCLLTKLDHKRTDMDES